MAPRADADERKANASRRFISMKYFAQRSIDEAMQVAKFLAACRLLFDVTSLKIKRLAIAWRS